MGASEIATYNQPTPPVPIENTAGEWHNYFLWSYVNEIKNQGIIPWSSDFAKYNIEILHNNSLITQEEKNNLDTLVDKVFASYNSYDEAKQEIQGFANYILAQNPGKVTEAICNLCISSVQIWYENNAPSANPTQLGISIPTYRGDLEGALCGMAVGGVIGAFVGGLSGAIEGAVIGGTAGGVVVSTFNWVYDNFC